jgi:O-antigen/teichoic acid export membrane protein
MSLFRFKGLINISIYIIVSVISAGINFFLLPVLSHHLLPADYAIVSLLNTYVLLLMPLISLLSYAVLGVEFFKMKDKREYARLFSSALFVPVIPTFLLLLFLLVSFRSLALIMELPATGWLYVYMAVFCFVLNVIEVANLYMVTAKKAKLFAIFNLSKVVLEALLTLYFVVHLKQGWEGRIHSWFIVSVLFALVSFLIFYKESLLSLRISWKYIWLAITFGTPLIAHTIGKFIVNQSDRLFIAKMVTLEEAGIYNVGYTIGSMIMILITALSNYYSPIIMESLHKQSEGGLIKVVKANYQFLAIMVLGFIALNLASPLIFNWLISHNYQAATPYVFWISLGYLFWGGYMLFAPVIYYKHKTRFLGYLSVINVVLNIALNFALIPIWGGVGAAIATLISFFMLFIIIASKSNSLISLPWSTVKFKDAFK